MLQRRAGQPRSENTTSCLSGPAVLGPPQCLSLAVAASPNSKKKARGPERQQDTHATLQCRHTATDSEIHLRWFFKNSIWRIFLSFEKRKMPLYGKPERRCPGLSARLVTAAAERGGLGALNEGLRRVWEWPSARGWPGRCVSAGSPCEGERERVFLRSLQQPPLGKDYAFPPSKPSARRASPFTALKPRSTLASGWLSLLAGRWARPGRVAGALVLIRPFEGGQTDL